MDDDRMRNDEELGRGAENEEVGRSNEEMIGADDEFEDVDEVDDTDEEDVEE